jgi:hypothetical protein
MCVAGNSLMTCSRFMLAIDGKVSNQNIVGFVTALSMLFTSYFAFNIEYLPEASATMEFIQRYISTWFNI